MRSRIVAMAVAALIGTVAGCSTPPQPPAPAPAPAPEPAPPPAPPPAPDTCGAAEHQNLVGRPRSEIPTPVRPERQRVACTTCPVTMDYRADRLNFYFDAATGIIKEVRCG
ncbi:peptidase inhibitor I78 [Phenylobacterium sp. SCN 70-31]|uniref:peptidase inhibitor I78 n=1 Tax=Phenylobacterium sp. SCN 70-31 TaxID=1660129 RepID=UPI00086C62F5|nr:peptidase inhibitor I78 [Phenylobacterium sp. SCN 70-31]ODT85872.1 MAG: peptidase inhibitor I78 [Phenylobacterium sp. SCN 70-31]